MSEYEDLIAEARRQSNPPNPIGAGHGTRLILAGLVKALEKVTAERDVLSSLREQMSLRLRCVVGKREQAVAERDQLAAVVEQVREFAESQKRPHVDVAGILPILNAAPFVALDRVKAEAFDEGWLKARDFLRRDSGWHPRDNPYRKGESNDQ